MYLLVRMTLITDDENVFFVVSKVSSGFECDFKTVFKSGSLE